MSYLKKPAKIDPDQVDPSVYYYDEVYDDLKEQSDRTDGKDANRDKPKGAKYIRGLQESADIRKSERELRKFKKHSRDREEVTEDTEVFITSAYKRKLDEYKKIEDEKRRRVERDRDNLMNFVKQNEVDKIEKPGSSKNLDTPTKPTNLKTCHDDSQFEHSDTPKPTQLQRTKLESREERLDYLRQVLAKRTVGKIFENAVSRYKQRKALPIK